MDQRFPATLYNPSGGTRTVRSAEEEQAALDMGFCDRPDKAGWVRGDAGWAPAPQPPPKPPEIEAIEQAATPPPEDGTTSEPNGPASAEEEAQAPKTPHPMSKCPCASGKRYRDCCGKK